MSVIIDENVSASLDEKLGANVWWKPDIDKKTLKSLCVKRSSPGALYVSLYFIALICLNELFMLLLAIEVLLVFITGSITFIIDAIAIYGSYYYLFLVPVAISLVPSTH